MFIFATVPCLVVKVRPSLAFSVSDLFRRRRPQSADHFMMLRMLRDLPITPMRPLGILNSARLVGVRALGCVKVIEFMFTGLQSE